jgi:transcriptional regulator with GAF, ATPase, and Fis domain
MTINQFKKEFGIIGNSTEINDLVDIVMQVAESNISILIYGESGVGKEVFARAIHGFSPRSAKPIVSVNCAAIPEGILESELFGHKKGSFTGALDNRKGYFEIADGGTLFLDEIAEMPLSTQVKLLRAIESREFIKIGDETVTRVDVRFIAATNKDLQKEVDARRFREDLFFRLKAVSLNIPPLRKRKGDIEELAYHFLSLYSASNNIRTPEITPAAMSLLREFPWPGNIRELKNVIESASTLSRTGIIDETLLSTLLKVSDYDHTGRNLPVYLRKSSEDLDRELLYRGLYEIKKDLVELKDLMYQKQSNDETGNNTEIKTLREIEKDAILIALEKAKGNKRAAASMLDISERTLYRKLREYEIDQK